MKKLFYLFAFVAGTINFAQGQALNSLAFDGVDDIVVVPNGSSYVVNASEMSITCWVYPTNGAPNYPNYDGFAGFRNDNDADFYLVQVGPAALEGRFRNSSGTAFTLTSSVLTLNTWQHIALVYSNTAGTLSLYKNGVFNSSIPANGTISNGAVDFQIGNVEFTSANFLLTGKMDETSFWSKALTPSDLSCMPVNGIDTSSVGLLLYYKFNQGIAGGANAAITTLKDETGTQDGSLNGFTMTGSASNFVAGYSASATATTGFTCPDAGYTWNGNTYYTAGTYYDTIPSSNGCDSLLQLNLFLLFVDTVVNVNNGTLTANHVGVGYQWLDCNNGYAPIAGATARNFTPAVIGSYACIVSQSGCTDTSGCHAITSVGLNTLDALSQVQIYPTATDGKINLQFAQINKQIEASVYDLSGRKLLTFKETMKETSEIDIATLSSGNYLLVVQGDAGTSTHKIIRK